MIVETLLLSLITLFAFYMHKRHNYFKKHNIDYAPGYFPFGSSLVWKCFTGQESLLQVADSYYDQFPNAKAFGFFKPFGQPVLAIKDLDLAKRIMGKDFDHFIDREFVKPNPKANKHATLMLTLQKGEKWRIQRSTLTPMFTSSKLKAIMPLVNQCGEDLVSYVAASNEIDCKEVCSRFTIELLGTLGCGIKPNVLQKGQNVFFDQAMKLSGAAEPNLIDLLRFTFLFFFPDIAYALNMPLFNGDNIKYFTDIMTNSLKSRTDKSHRRNDFIDLIKDAVEELDEEKKKELFAGGVDLLDYITANGLMLFFVGNDTSSGALAYALHNLAKYPDLQEKVYQEVQDAIDENNDNQNLDYNSLNNLEYMGKFIRETIRLWGLNFFDRTCTKDYFVPELNFTIPKGMHVTLAGGNMHKSSDNFEDPLSFDPEKHFENNSQFHPNFIGFGQGPRNCIGMRLAYIIIRTGLVHIVANYKIAKGPKFKDTFDWIPNVPGGIGHGSMHVSLEPRK